MTYAPVHVRILGRPCHAMRLAMDLAVSGATITGTHRRHDAHDGHGPRPTLHLLAEVAE